MPWATPSPQNSEGKKAGGERLRIKSAHLKTKAKLTC